MKVMAVCEKNFGALFCGNQKIYCSHLRPETCLVQNMLLQNKNKNSIETFEIIIVSPKM